MWPEQSEKREVIVREEGRVQCWNVEISSCVKSRLSLGQRYGDRYFR